MVGMSEPINIHAAFSTFDAIWSPRIVTEINDYDVRIAKVKGEHVWHVHDNTDEFFMVMEGVFDIALRENGAERSVRLQPGDVYVVARGTEHRPSSADGAQILMFEPTGTSTTGDRHDEIPDHVDSTIGHGL